MFTINENYFQEDLNTALEAIRGGMAVQKAATEFGIPSGTLYGRCKKVGIELSKNTQVAAHSHDRQFPDLFSPPGALV